MMPLAAYADRVSARPGERVVLRVSSVPGAYDADLVRMLCADPNPASPGVQFQPVPSGFEGRRAGRVQAIRIGSCAAAPIRGLVLPSEWTLAVRVQPGVLDGQVRVVLALGGLVLRVTPEGVALDVPGAGPGAEPGGAACTVRVLAPMLERRWYELRAVFADGTVELRQTALRRSWGVADSGAAVGECGPVCGPVCGPAACDAAWFGAAPDGEGWAGVLDGRMEDPVLLRGAHRGDAPLEPDRAGDALVAWWDFGADIPTGRVTDRGPSGWHGSVRNLPTRAVRGSRWDGCEQCWRHAPRHYAAVQFNADDLYDCEWDESFAWDVPPSLPSGIYGIRLRAEGHEEVVPVWVLPPRGMATAPVAFLASTFTYQAYANHARGNADAAYKARRAAWGAYPHNPDEHPEYGRSTYNRHPDGSGVALSSLRRPVLTMRPGFLTFNDPRGSGLRHFPADSHLVAWLTRMGHAFDVLTDHDLHREGAALLQPYQAVLTGSHPEYHTPQTLDALGKYTAGGGRLAYLGGNGFYWRIAVSEALPDVLEVRRAEGGIRAWDAQPGEAYHQLDGGYGGLWRRVGRPPQELVGIGFSAQGLFEGSHYRLLPAARSGPHAWVFEGVDEDPLGGYGLSGGGAAGFELDRADARLGSPPNLVVLARSEGHQPHFVAVPEELLSHVNTVTGERPADLIRGEITYFDTAHGGAVFAVGSITFCGSLLHADCRNGVSRLLDNVLRRWTSA